jgi:hypothetical protein
VKTSDAEQFNIPCSRRFKEMGLKYVTLLKLYQNRVEEMKSIPAGQFREMADGRQIAFIIHLAKKLSRRSKTDCDLVPGGW